MNPEIFIEVGLVLIVALIIAGFMKLLKQPSIIAYIVAGIFAGPYFLNIINSTDTFTALSQKGVALLLFAVGLGMNPKVIKEVGSISLITGIGQVLFTSIVGYFISIYLGFSTITSIFIAIALTFSSTIVIMKLISDKQDTEKLYAKISVGFLIVQDLIVIILLLIISTMKQGANFGNVFTQIAINGLVSIFVLYLISAFILPVIMYYIAKSQEMLFLFSITWCFAIASFFHILNFSIEAGALIAGMALSMSPYQYEIKSKMKPLRDFFLILFFVILGSQMVFSNIQANIIPIIVFSLFVLIGNPIIVMILMGIFGYTKRTSFNAGLTVAQISEFSLILVGLGIAMGFLENQILSIVTAIALITFAGSTYMIVNSEYLFEKLKSILSIFEKKKVKSERQKTKKKYDAIVIGYQNLGTNIISKLKSLKKKFIVVDHDPQKILELTKRGIDNVYGDINNMEFLNSLNLQKIKMIISTIPELETNLLLIYHIKNQNKKSTITVVANSRNEAIKLYEAGANYVVFPDLLSADHLNKLLGQKSKITKAKKKHIKKLK